ncbi:MAG: hypothetical protein B6245_06890 [Desulfobacteraceae bacterium 4572_88]|nr:MAG: hypothetical protein B6245_06890 [Desulfobacteraceae bacterium 4572_88]RLC18676.1 MAG: RNA-binding protein [Deltaproteobacteria bacterium]
MSPYSEFEGKTIEKAVRKACESLNIPMENLKYDVISYGSSGIFGLVGVKKARIRVSVPKLASESAASGDNGDQAKPVSKKKARRQPRKDARKTRKTGESKESEKTEEEAPAASAYKPSEEQEGVHVFSESPSELGREALQRIIDFITTDANISVRKTPERIFFNVEGGNTAVLIGKRGQTLEAIQYLVEKVINKQNAQRVRIQVDIEGYLDSRKTKLEGLAARLSEKAKRIGKPVTIGQLNAHDRRIVHIALKDDSGVRTQSMGDGFYRKLVIFPQKRAHRKKESA